MLNTVSTLKEFFNKQNRMLGDEVLNLNPDYSLLENGLIDSINLLKLIDYIEEKFGIKIDEEEMTPENFDTLNAISKLVTKEYVKLAETYSN